MINLKPIHRTASQAADDAGLRGEVGNTKKKCAATILEIGVFFDGTLNNRYNVISKAREDGSYQNALSNPALLHARYKMAQSMMNAMSQEEQGACFDMFMSKGSDRRRASQIVE